MVRTRLFWALLLFASAASPLLAQTAPAPHATSTDGAELSYRSTFEGYQPFVDGKVGSWRDANDTVGRIGGWRAYAKEAREPSSAAPAVPATGAPAADAPAKPRESNPDPHAGHGKR